MKQVTIEKVQTAARAAGLRTFARESYDDKHDAQRNLCGITHYVDDGALRYHKARILETRHSMHGLLYGIVESCALDMRGTSRGFRAVVFDVTGAVVMRQNLDTCYKTKKAALKDLDSALANDSELLAKCAENIACNAENMKRDAAAMAKLSKMIKGVK